MTADRSVYGLIQGKTVVHRRASFHSSLHAAGVKGVGTLNWLMWFETRLFDHIVKISGCFEPLYVSQRGKIRFRHNLSSSKKFPLLLLCPFKVTVTNVTL